MLQDYDTWSSLRKHYLSAEYHAVFSCIEKHYQKYHVLPTFEDLKFSVRDSATREKLLAIESIEVDVDAHMLLEYLKNEYTQKEILDQLEKYVDTCVSFENADESVDRLHQIVLDVESKVDLDDPLESMQRINLFEEEEELQRYVGLGLNQDYDYEIKFSPIDLILIGGRRGSGKSITCANIAANVYAAGKTAMYFTIEMNAKQTLQRIAAVACGIPFTRIRSKNLGVAEWDKLAKWWSMRYVDGEKYYEQYIVHRKFDKLHQDLSTRCTLNPLNQLDIVYDSKLTLSKIEAEVNKKAKALNVGIIIVDYLNQVKRGLSNGKGGQYDWTEQIEVSKALKDIAQSFEIPVISPYQTDSSGEARFAKGILDAADAAYSLEAHNPEDNCITFKCVKMRNNPIKDFTSQMAWDTLKIGPETAELPSKETKGKKTGEDINDI
jgi:replicative DNA helicase